MTKHTYVYDTYIVSTPEKVWEALTDAEISGRYWERQNVSDWKVGSPWEHRLPGKAPDVVGKVLESDPPHRLVTTWAPPLGQPGHDDPARHNRCAFDIEDAGGKVKLTVTHSELADDDLRDVSGGWPAVLSNLKTLLGAGRTIPDPFGAVVNNPNG